jgi:predicted ribosome quality control (RQC) complex YloA/Tae2 family protein
MSLNWKEIDLVLSELDLAGAKIEKVVQPSYDSISLRLFKAGRATELFVSIAQGACRIHALSSPPPKPTRALRFQECLKSRIVGGRLVSVAQLGSERVLRLDIEAPEPPALTSRDTVYKPVGQGARKVAARKNDDYSPRYRLYVRLWSGAGNVVLVDDEGLVVDALARRPKKGEISGEGCSIEEDLAASAGKAPAREFEPRDLPGDGGYNQRVERFYAESVGELSREKLLEAARERFGKRFRSLEAKIAELSARAAEFRDSGRLRELGDILMANQGASYDGKYLACEDFFQGGEIRIPIDPKLDPVGNARAYYERHKKARSGLEDVEAELDSSKASLEKLRAELASLEAEEDPFLIARALAKGGTSRQSAEGAPQKRSYPGLSLQVLGWMILIGRSAKENDELLRRHVRGSDLWLHARDWPGSYVFVKGQKGKSVPLEVLVDAGQLAIYYSKGRARGGGDLYYAFVKDLRRAKNGPVGLVLPTHEKNLSVKIDEARIKELRTLIGDDRE